MNRPWRDLTERYLAAGHYRTILLVEDDAEYVERVRTTLLGAEPDKFGLEVAPTLRQALEAIRGGDHDIILLDLGLPDQYGFATYDAVAGVAGSTPIVVITSSDDPDMAARLLYLGAQDYLIKQSSDELLMHVMGLAMARNRPESGVGPSEPEARASLRDRDQAGFDELTREYKRIVDLATRRRVLRTEGNEFRVSLRRMAEGLGDANASAKDALEIHSEAIRLSVDNETPDVAALVNESRLVALELMAQLAEYYRLRARTR